MRIVNDAARHPGSCRSGGSSIAAPPVVFGGTQVLAAVEDASHALNYHRQLESGKKIGSDFGSFCRSFSRMIAAPGG